MSYDYDLMGLAALHMITVELALVHLHSPN
jgi:hypothetical protein